MIKKNMCCRQVAIAKMVQFLGARRTSLRDAVCGRPPQPARECRTAPADFLPALPRTGFHET